MHTTMPLPREGGSMKRDRAVVRIPPRPASRQGPRGRAHTTTAGGPFIPALAPSILFFLLPPYTETLAGPPHHRACHQRPDSDRGDFRQQSRDALSGPENKPTGYLHAKVRDRGTGHQVHQAIVSNYFILPASGPFWAREWSDGAQSAIASNPPPFHTSWGRSP